MFCALNRPTLAATGIMTLTQLTLACTITTSSTEGTIGSQVGISVMKGTSGRLWHIGKEGLPMRPYLENRQHGRGRTRG
jgi:hypothetical protein